MKKPTLDYAGLPDEEQLRKHTEALREYAGEIAAELVKLGGKADAVPAINAEGDLFEDRDALDVYVTRAEFALRNAQAQSKAKPETKPTGTATQRCQVSAPRRVLIVKAGATATEKCLAAKAAK